MIYMYTCAQCSQGSLLPLGIKSSGLVHVVLQDNLQDNSHEDDPVTLQRTAETSAVDEQQHPHVPQASTYVDFGIP